MKTFDPSRALAIAAGVVIIALTATAFWLSYAHLAEVALGHGLGSAEIRAWAWPACLDLFIIAGEIMWLRAALAKQIDCWAIGLTAIGSLGSIILNVAGVTGARDPGTVPILDYVVAAVPPTAALLAFGALMRQVHQALARRVDVVPDAAVPAKPAAAPRTTQPAPVAVPEGVRLLPITARPAPASKLPERLPVLAAEAPRTRTVVRAEYVPERDVDGAPVVDPDPLLDAVRRDHPELIAMARTPSVRLLRSEYGIGQARAQRIRDAFLPRTVTP